jgi:hypothetical protein
VLERPQLLLDLGQRMRQLLAPSIVRSAFKLPAQLGESQAQRLSASQLLWVALGSGRSAPCPLVFALVHPFLDPILGVD